jgi:hypothetical protein
MGYVSIVADTHRVKSVIFTSVTKGPDGKMKIAHLDDDKTQLSYTEFRACVAMQLPKLRSNPPVSMDTTERRDVLNPRDETVLATFGNPKRASCVDALNLAYANLVALRNPKSKATAELYLSARNAWLNSSHGVPMVDADGHEFASFNEVPDQVSGYLRSTYRFKDGGRKRPREEPKVPAKDAEMAPVDNVPQASSGQVIRPVRKLKGKAPIRGPLPEKAADPLVLQSPEALEAEVRAIAQKEGWSLGEVQEEWRDIEMAEEPLFNSRPPVPHPKRVRM